MKYRKGDMVPLNKVYGSVVAADKSSEIKDLRKILWS